MPRPFDTQKVRKIVCILKNYHEHAKEMGGQVPTQVEFFLKPTTAFLQYGGAAGADTSSAVGAGSPKQFIEIPAGCDVHHEVELGVVIGKPGRDISRDSAMEHVRGYVLALDMTARNVQAAAKSAGKPWTVAKGYDTFCPVSDVMFEKAEVADPHNVELWLRVNGKDRQRDSTSMMVFSIQDIIEAVSRVMTLEENDLILTGTPSGVGSVKPGDTVTAGISDLSYEFVFGAKQRGE